MWNRKYLFFHELCRHLYIYITAYTPGVCGIENICYFTSTVDISTFILQHIPPGVCGIENICQFTSTVDISSIMLQHIPPGVCGIENICLIHEHCEYLYIYIMAYTPPPPPGSRCQFPRLLGGRLPMIPRKTY